MKMWQYLSLLGTMLILHDVEDIGKALWAIAIIFLIAG